MSYEFETLGFLSRLRTFRMWVKTFFCTLLLNVEQVVFATPFLYLPVFQAFSIAFPSSRRSC